ncbi:hypothetical protein KIW84_040290 [Lathyrus oleraceus]|uniref:Tify domain-containing protein n=1 Tax=Pisum sativum TaxID=3888 RepID=A0A9D4X9T7_PEA|nr:hypothetical protein KIW84_040290 [Pisum sativum]
MFEQPLLKLTLVDILKATDNFSKTNIIGDGGFGTVYRATLSNGRDSTIGGNTEATYSRVLSAYEFEQHAGAKTRHPNNHVSLENGKPIYSIIHEIKTAPNSMPDEIIKNVAGASINEGTLQVRKESLLESNKRLE